MGIILKLSKSNFCLTRVKWFRRDFHSHGVTADPDKIRNIQEGGRPGNTEDVMSPHGLPVQRQVHLRQLTESQLRRSYGTTEEATQERPEVYIGNTVGRRIPTADYDSE